MLRRVPPATTNIALRELLASALRRRGYRRLAKDEPGSPLDHIATGLSVGLLASVLVGIVVALMITLDWTVLEAAGATFLALTIVAVATRKEPKYGFLAFLLLWAAIGIARWIDAGFGALLTTHVLPFLIVAAGFGMARALRLAVGVPLLLPIALLVVSFPLLSQDLWDLGSDMKGHLGWVAVVAIGPILLLVLIRLTRVSVPATFDQAAARIEETPEPEAAAVKVAKTRAPHDLRDAVDDDVAAQELSGGFGRPDLDRGTARAIEVQGKGFKRRTVLRLLPLTLGLAAAIALFIYLLAVAAIPIDTAERWAMEEIPQEPVSVLGLDIALPVGPYLQVPALLAIVGTAAFLAFVLTEDRYSTALYESLVHRPAYECLMLTAALLHLGPPPSQPSEETSTEEPALTG